MNSQEIIKNWLAAWLRPELKTAYNIAPQPALSNANFNSWISMFLDEKEEPVFPEKSRKTIKNLVTKPMLFGTGYPFNEKETIQTCSIYIIKGGWDQTSKFTGSNYWDGRGGSYIAVTGATRGKNLNLTEPSLMIEVITSLLLSGHNYFVANHLMDPVIRETPYEVDEANSFDKQIAIRTSSISYDEHRFMITTHLKHEIK